MEMRFDVYCDTCKFKRENQPNRLKVERPAKKHLKKTGHSLTIYRDRKEHSTLRKIQSLKEIQ